MQRKSILSDTCNYFKKKIIRLIRDIERIENARLRESKKFSQLIDYSHYNTYLRIALIESKHISRTRSEYLSDQGTLINARIILII